MKKNEKGITLFSLVITIVVLALLAAVLVNASIDNSPAMELLNAIRDDYYEEQTQTEEKVNRMVNGWENIILE